MFTQYVLHKHGFLNQKTKQFDLNFKNNNLFEISDFKTLNNEICAMRKSKRRMPKFIFRNRRRQTKPYGRAYTFSLHCNDIRLFDIRRVALCFQALLVK